MCSLALKGFHGPHFKRMVAEHHLGYIRSIQGTLKRARGLDFTDLSGSAVSLEHLDFFLSSLSDSGVQLGLRTHWTNQLISLNTNGQPMEIISG